MTKKNNSVNKLISIMCLLRKKCPWDKKQTLGSLISLTIEEVYELQDSVIKKKYNNIKNELGDILMHIIFYSIICDEEKEFDFSDVVNSVINKLVYRHPHVFGDKDFDESEVKKNWELLKIKDGEKSVLSGVPSNLSALIKSFRIQEKVSNVGFEFDNKLDVLSKLKEEITELEEAIKINDKDNIELELGDVLFSLVNYSRYIKVDPESALQKTNNKFISRFKNMEADLYKDGLSFKEAKKKDLNNYWEKQKIKK